MEWLQYPLVRGLWRGFKTALAVGVSAFLVSLTEQPGWLGLAPILLFLDKWTRARKE